MKKENEVLQKNLNTAHELDKYLKDRGRRHKYYRNYGRFPRLSTNIYSEQALFLSDGTSWNDLKDVENFKNKDGNKKNYGLCFSYSIDESVAMWMLYGGLEDKGGMYYFTQKQMQKIIDSRPTIRLGFFDKENNIFIEKKNISKSDYSLYIKDVLYCSAINENLYRVYRDSESGTTQKSVLKGADCVLKHPAWSYEKETRLILEVSLTNSDDEIMQCTHAKIYMEDIFGKNWLNGFNKQIIYSPKRKTDKKARVLYKNKQIGFIDSLLTGMIDWEIK